MRIHRATLWNLLAASGVYGGRFGVFPRGSGVTRPSYAPLISTHTAHAGSYHCTHAIRTEIAPRAAPPLLNAWRRKERTRRCATAAEKQFTKAEAPRSRNRLRHLGESASIEVAPDIAEVGIRDVEALPNGTYVYVNMIKKSLHHFEEVVAASRALVTAGLMPVPHLPAARFGTDEECQSIIHEIASVGANQILVIGGNDLKECSEAGACAYPSGAHGLLANQVRNLKGVGFHAIALAGHPDGLPGLGYDGAATMASLVEKARAVLQADLDVVVVTQFCLDARKLLRWLDTSRAALGRLQGNGSTAGRVSYRIGLPGPTPRGRLGRIAEICGVPSSGPSMHVRGILAASEVEPGKEADPAVWPEDLVLALAEYCERDDVAAGDVSLHFYPFGGMSKTLDLISMLRAGSWPGLSE